jgi:hypothetical protein
MQWDRSVTTVLCSGMRKMQTFKKLPITIPNKNMTTNMGISSAYIGFLYVLSSGQTIAKTFRKAREIRFADEAASGTRRAVFRFMQLLYYPVVFVIVQQV